MTIWNPNDPNAVGVEFLPELTRSWTVGSTGGAENGVGQKFRSTVAESIDHLSVFATAVTGSGVMLAEVLEDGDETLANVAISAVAPATATNVVNFRNQAGSSVPANLIASIDETGDPTNNTDYIYPHVSGSPQTIDLQFDGTAIATAVAGKRVLGVAVGIRALQSTASDLSDHYEFRVVDVATDFEHIVLNRHVPTTQENWWNLGEVFRSADYSLDAEPWNETNLAEFATGGDLVIRVGTSGGDGLKFSRVRMVIATADENRQAVAVVDPRNWDEFPGLATLALPATDTTSGITGLWSDAVPLLEPDGAGGTWSKADDTTYRVWFRRASLGNIVNNLAVTIPVLSRYDDELPPTGTFLDDPLVSVPQSYSGPSTATWPTVVATSPASARDAAGGNVEPIGMLPFRLLLTAGADDSVDGQPYSQVLPIPVNTSDGAVYQLVTTGAGGDYTAVRIPVGWSSAAGPTADLAITILDSTGVTTIATGTLTRAAYLAIPEFDGPDRLHEMMLDIEGTLAAATQYRVRFSSTATADDGWLIGLLTTRGASLATGPVTGNEADASYGGEVDYAVDLPSGLSADPWDDLAVFLGLALDGPTDVAVSAGGDTFEHAEPCGIERVPWGKLTWTASAAGADFLRYRVQRRDTIDTEWADVAYLTTENLVELFDVEARLGDVASEWRIRSEGIEGQASLWSDVVTTSLSIDHGYTFTTMVFPFSSVAYADVYESQPVRDYTFPDAAEAQVRRFAGRDEFVVFRPLEQRSVRFSRQMLVRSFLGSGTGLVGPDAFDALRDLCRSDAPYVCVRDESGNRWFAAVLVTEGSVRMAAEHHRCVVDVIPVSRTPVPITIEG